MNREALLPSLNQDIVSQNLLINFNAEMKRHKSFKLEAIHSSNGTFDIEKLHSSTSVLNRSEENMTNINPNNLQLPLMKDQQSYHKSSIDSKEEEKLNICNTNIIATDYFGNLNSTGDDFDDYQSFVHNLVKENFHVDIFRIKIYSDGDSIVGIKPVYSVGDKNDGNKQTIYREHRGSKYSWVFSKRLNVVLEKEEKIIALSGFYTESINQICVHTNLKEYSIGKKNGNQFIINSGKLLRLIAIGGRVKETLTRLSGFFQ